MKIRYLIAAALGTIVMASGAQAEQQCWVGTQYNDSSQWSIACTQTYGMGSQILAQKGYAHIVFGPATWDKCKAWADKNIPKG